MSNSMRPHRRQPTPNQEEDSREKLAMEGKELERESMRGKGSRKKKMGMGEKVGRAQDRKNDQE